MHHSLLCGHYIVSCSASQLFVGITIVSCTECIQITFKKIAELQVASRYKGAENLSTIIVDF